MRDGNIVNGMKIVLLLLLLLLLLLMLLMLPPPLLLLLLLLLLMSTIAIDILISLQELLLLQLPKRSVNLHIVLLDIGNIKRITKT
jgi:hypothetical protein